MIPSAKKIAWMIVKAPETRSAEETGVIQQIGQDRDSAVLIRLVRQFVDLVRRVGTKPRDAGPIFNEWLLEAKDCGVCQRRSNSRPLGRSKSRPRRWQA